MARKKSATLTEGELRIMEALWDLGSGSVKAVTEQVSAEETLAYNTVQTMLGILEDKGYVNHEKEGRAFVYTPTVSRHKARNRALKHLIQRFFDGSPEAVMQNLLAEEDVDMSELQKLRDQVKKAKE